MSRCVWRTGIIPARAGFTRRGRLCARPVTDHPRSRGVYKSSNGALACLPGSSPLARGLPLRHRAPRAVRRIIPARAGFTQRAWPRGCRPGDHPRSRGVYVRELPDDDRGLGSSPLARGLLESLIEDFKRRRIIPARAGFTLTMCAVPLREGDHPRSRGVYALSMNQATVDQGSSPLARGLRSEVTDFEHVPGIIPARAGFTGR